MSKNEKNPYIGLIQDLEKSEVDPATAARIKLTQMSNDVTKQVVLDFMKWYRTLGETKSAITEEYSLSIFEVRLSIKTCKKKVKEKRRIKKSVNCQSVNFEIEKSRLMMLEEVWCGLEKLKCTQAFVTWLQHHPEIKAPEYFIDRFKSGN